MPAIANYGHAAKLTAMGCWLDSARHNLCFSLEQGRVNIQLEVWILFPNLFKILLFGLQTFHNTILFDLVIKTGQQQMEIS